MFLIDDILIIAGSALVGGAIGSVVGGAAGALVGWAIDYFLDEDSIGTEVKTRYSEAFKILIQKKKKQAVNIGIFSDETTIIESDLEIESTSGISDSLYEGQVIYV